MKTSKSVLLPLALLGLATALAGLAVWIDARRAPESPSAKSALFPGLAERINDVARIEVTGHDTHTVLVRAAAGEGWVVESQGGYPARFSDVKQAAVAVAGLRILERKTTKPGLYPRLGVEDPQTTGAKSVRLDLANAAGQPLAALVVGHPREMEGGAGGARERDGGGARALYVRRAGEAESLLVEGELTLSADPLAWMETGLFDIPAERVSAVEIAYPDGQRLTLARQGDALALGEGPPGFVPKTTAGLTTLASAAAGVRFEEVRAAAKAPLPKAGRMVMTVKTVDGLVVTGESANLEGKGLTQFRFAFDEALAQASAPAPATAAAAAATAAAPAAAPAAAATGHKPGEPPATAAAAAAAGKPTETSPAEKPAAPGAKPKVTPRKPEEVKAEIARLNQATQGWLYRLPDFQREVWTKPLAELLIPPAEAARAAAAAAKEEGGADGGEGLVPQAPAGQAGPGAAAPGAAPIPAKGAAAKPRRR
jgi:hypothetical protein